jgi:hypothetical protein
MLLADCRARAVVGRLSKRFHDAATHSESVDGEPNDLMDV